MTDQPTLFDMPGQPPPPEPLHNVAAIPLSVPGWDDHAKLSHARNALRPMIDDGVCCPVCTQFAKVYRRRIHTTMARNLITVARAGTWDARGWVEVGVVVGRSSPDLVKLRYWGLLEPMGGRRADQSTRVGQWRVTGLGLAWVRDEALVPKYAHIYDGRLLGLSGEPVGILTALRGRFDYAELMET